MAGALVREGAAVGVARARGRLGQPGAVPARLGEVTPAWLGACLGARWPAARVASVRVLDVTAGTTDRVRLAVDYTPAGVAGAPESVFVKLAPAATATRLFCNLMALGTTEVRFYREIAPALPVRVPDALCAVSDRAQGFALVLEDLAAGSAAFSDVAHPVDAARAGTVVAALARLHAALWESPRFRSDLAWLRAPGRNPLVGRERALCALALRPGLARFPDLVPAAIRDAAGRVLAARDRLDARWAARPLTLVHGDDHLGNLFWEGEEVGFLDWQVTQIGPGMRDVSYFLVTSLPVEVRRAHERALIERYLAVLAERGVAAPSFEDAWRDHRLLACHAWIAAIVTAAAPALQPEPVARAAVDRACRALVDLDSLRALADLGA